MDEIFGYASELIIYAIYGIVTMIITAIAVIINRKRVRNKMETLDYSDHKQKRKRNYTRNLLLDEQVTLKIKEEDTAFDENAFKEWAKELFIDFYKAWTNKNMMPIRSRVDNNLYEQYKNLLNTNVGEGNKSVIDIKQVNYADFSLYSRDNEKEIIEIALNAVTIEYLHNEETGKIIEGSKDIKNRTTYKMIFYRKFGLQSGEEKEFRNCPNCGAEIDKAQNKCEYCKTWILNCIKNWELNSIEKY